MHSIHTLFTSKVPITIMKIYLSVSCILYCCIVVLYCTVVDSRTTILFKIDSMAGTRYYRNQEVD